MNHDELEIDIFDEDYLAHYGVKGMKWGVRKNSVTSNGRRASARVKTRLKRVSKKLVSRIDSDSAKEKIKNLVEAKKVAKANRESSKEKKSRQVRNMSDEELRSRIDRIRLENEYYKETQSRSDKIKNKVKSEIGNALTNAGKDTAKKTMELYLQYAITGGKENNGKFSDFAKENWNSSNKKTIKPNNSNESKKSNKSESSNTDGNSSKSKKSNKSKNPNADNSSNTTSTKAKRVIKVVKDKKIETSSQAKRESSVYVDSIVQGIADRGWEWSVQSKAPVYSKRNYDTATHPKSTNISEKAERIEKALDRVKARKISSYSAWYADPGYQTSYRTW